MRELYTLHSPHQSGIPGLSWGRVQDKKIDLYCPDCQKGDVSPSELPGKINHKGYIGSFTNTVSYSV